MLSLDDFGAWVGERQVAPHRCMARYRWPVAQGGALSGEAGQLTQDLEHAAEWRATGTDGAPALRDLATERLAAHRQRRAAVRAEQHAAQSEQQVRQERSRSASRAVQEVVARRYQNSVSYHEFLAVEAERAIAQAQAEAEVAARTAAAVAEAQMKLLGEIEQWRETETSPREAILAEVAAERRHHLADAMADIALAATELLAKPSPRIELVATPVPEPSVELPQSPLAAEMRTAGVTVRLYEELGAVGPMAPVAAASGLHDGVWLSG